MKRITIILVVLIGITFTLSAQSPGTYRSVGSGNWNDATNWEMYVGSTWVPATEYPGQNSVAGSVSIVNPTTILLTESVPHGISFLSVDADSGRLVFSSENPVSLTVTGSIAVAGALYIDNRNGAKTHTLIVGGSFEIGNKISDPTTYCPPYAFIPASFQSINQDDKLSIVFTNGGTIDGGPDGITFQDITFNGAGFTVANPIYVASSATFVNGIVTTYSSDGCVGTHNADCNCDAETYSGSITFLDNAIVRGASAASFVDATVTKIGDDSFTFPVGNGNIFAPLTISAPSAGSYVSARYIRSNASDLGPISDPGLFSVSNCEYWYLEAGGFNDLDVTVGWNAASGCGSSSYITDVSEVTLAHFDYYTTGTWDSHGGSGTGTVTNGSITRHGVTGSGFFAFGNLRSACDAPWGLSATNISLNSATLNWSPVSNSASYDVDYKPYTSGQWINVATGTTSTSVNLSGLDTGMYYDWRIRSNCSLSSSSYRQAPFQTLCGAASGLTATNITTYSAKLSWSPFGNYVSYTVEYKQSTSNTWIVAAAGIGSPSYTLSGLLTGTTYDWRVVLNCSLSGPGNYAQASFTTVSCGAPTGLFTTNITTSSATVNWVPVANAVRYDVAYKLSTSTTWIFIATGITSPSFNLAGLSGYTAYDWRVDTYCSAGPGNYAQASFTTSACNDVYESNNTSSQAKTISLGMSISANIPSATDVDWFKVTMPNNSYTTLQGTLTNLPADYDLYVYNKNLVLVASSTNIGTANESVIYNSRARNATYYIKVAGKSGAYNAIQCYNLLAQAVGSGGLITSATSDRNNEMTDASSEQVLYPNPASEFVYLRFNSTTEGMSEVRIENTIGQLVKKYAVKISIGNNVIRIPLRDVSPGVHILRTSDGRIGAPRKFVISR